MVRLKVYFDDDDTFDLAISIPYGAIKRVLEYNDDTYVGGFQFLMVQGDEIRIYADYYM